MSHESGNKNTARNIDQTGERHDQGLGGVATCSIIRLKDEERTRCEVWTRVMGYHRPVSAFNPGKKSEHAERKLFLEHNWTKEKAKIRRAVKGFSEATTDEY